MTFVPSYGPYYPDDMTGPMVCIAEGCAGPNCSRCGKVNYAWLGYLGYIGRMAKKWGVPKDEAERRIEERQLARYEASICKLCGHDNHLTECNEDDLGTRCGCKVGAL